jgi:periplasmic protein CpxP/Spy
MNKEIFWKRIAIGLLFLNIVILGFVFLKTKFMPEGKHIAPYLVSKLGLNQEQRATYKASVDRHRAASDILLTQEQDVSKQLILLMRSTVVDSLAYHQKSKEMLDIRAKIIQTNFNHFHELRNICTPEQQLIFDEIINEILNKMNGQRLKK